MCSSYIQNRENIERLEITGVGDPSGRGLGFSYVRATPKAPITNSVVKRKAVVSKGSTVTGTDADLRRLSMEAAREVCWVLLCMFFVAPKCSYILKLVDSILAFEMLCLVSAIVLFFLVMSSPFYLIFKCMHAYVYHSQSNCIFQFSFPFPVACSIRLCIFSSILVIYFLVNHFMAKTLDHIYMSWCRWCGRLG